MQGTKLVIVVIVAAALAFSLSLFGCNEQRAGDLADERTDLTTSPADHTATATEFETPAEPEIVAVEQREARIAAQERELAAQTEVLAQREAVIAEREQTLAQTEPVIPDAPFAEPAVVEPEPQFETILVTVPSDTAIEVEFLDDLSSEVNFAGDPFMTRVARDVVVGETLVVPAGAEILGTVAEATPAKKIGGQARLALAFDRLRLPSGETTPIRASLLATGEKQTKKDAATIGGATAGGAILGRILDKKHGSKGTTLGAIVGAAVGTAIAAKNSGDPVAIDRGTLAGLQLDEPLRIAVTVPATREAFAEAR